jgi:hypothetical protein
MNHNRRAALPIGSRWLFDKTSKGLTAEGAQATGYFKALLIDDPHGLIGREVSG